MSSVDVIVPCYRYAHFLRECVESVLSQSGPSVRVLIIDDASPDDTADVATTLAKNDSRVTVRRHSANVGHIATYNEGIEWVSADYMLLLSADDYLLPGALNRAVTLMESHPEVGFTFGYAVELSENGAARWNEVTPCHTGVCTISGKEFILLSGARDIVRTPTAVVLTKLQHKVGGYRPELPHAGDMEMWLRLAAHASVGFVASDQAVYRRHSTNMSLSFDLRHSLPDLEQRRTVFEFFFKHCGHLLSDSQRLHSKLLYLLACDAVTKSSAAFNDGNMEVSAQIADLAVDIFPGITRSAPWRKLALKRWMGLRVWRALQILKPRKNRRNWLLPVSPRP
jgi:glycosyltransferase involved in cell wall biosynthesis